MSGNKADQEAAFLSEDQLFDALTKSAFEFLDRSIGEFSESAKFSTVHFAVAIELFLKARLMREHWSLLLDKPDLADKAAFFKGNAKTVTPDQAIERLRRIASVSITQGSRDIFNKIANHRNKMVHFAHAGEAAVDGPEGRSSIAEEQCAGWLALRALLGEWREFDDYVDDIWRISRKLEGHRTYLQKAFEIKARELQAHRDAGLRASLCPSCQFESVKVEEPIGLISEASCVVCRYSGAEITVTCGSESCGEYIVFAAYDGSPDKCPHCDAALSNDVIRDCLDTGEEVTKDNYFEIRKINCPHCSGYHSVVEHHDIFICLNCFEMDREYGVCGYCSEGQLGGVPEHSSLVGCEFCEGSAGRLRDD